MDTPLNYHSNRGLPDYYRELQTLVNFPLVLHNDPEAVHTTRTFKRHNIRTAVLKELVQIEGIVGLIFSGSLERSHHYQRACRGRQHFRLYDGDEKRFLEHPSMGGVVSVGANLAPVAWEKITQSSIQLHAHRENYPDRLQQIWESGGLFEADGVALWTITHAHHQGRSCPNGASSKVRKCCTPRKSIPTLWKPSKGSWRISEITFRFFYFSIWLRRYW